MQPVYQLVTATGTTAPVVLDYMQVPFEATVTVEEGAGVSALSAQVQYTFDDIQASSATSFSAQAFNPAQVGWTPVWIDAGSPLTASGTVLFTGGASTSSSGPFPGPVRAVRVNVGTLTGGNVMVTVLQGVNQRAG